ncbi:SMP-30/gluconolactonase/LRE family protein [Algicella marina]|uniref:SMP-30/gluconolactonase/LRE family protein n=1 Tax=Algicella marina TaxID=2683284 RepID=A0A6P1T3F9_9RHOB|nr:SMP-30/gluconolactonase/LRE family protein [Algicella marina]QHQ36301.1 SMP-30/gluconolactonase/LRE family protein [Algicella marina]
MTRQIPGAAIGLEGLVDPSEPLEIVATGSIWSEGPLWIPARNCLRWSDIPNNRIREYDAATGEVTDYATDVEFTNGRTLDLDGSVVQCSHGRRRVERDRGGVVTSIVDEWNGVRLNSPNDVVIAPDGTIWFTDPAYGITEAREGHPGEREYGDHFVFRHNPTDGTTLPVVIDVEEPNGLAFSPDGSLFYVADSSSVRKPPGVGNSDIRVYDVHEGLRCKNGRLFAHIDEGFPDGIAVDMFGNVWSSSEIGVIVFAPDGAELGRILVPELTGNLCFGGVDGHSLFIAASTSIYRIATMTSDAWAGRPRKRSAPDR